MAKKAGEVSVEVLPVAPQDSGIPAIILEPYIDDVDGGKTVAVKGNFEKVLADVERLVLEVKQEKLSVKDLDSVTKYKASFRGYRTYVDSVEAWAKKRFFNGPKDIFVAQVEPLKKKIEEGEALADKVLDKLEKARVDGLTKIFDTYKSSFQEKYGLSTESLKLVVYDQKYFNKSAKEKETKDAIEAQFIALKTRETALASGEKTIRKLCAGNPLLDVERYVANLITGSELAIIMDEIEAEEERLADVQNTRAVDAEEAPEAEWPAKTPDAASISVGVIGAASKFLGSGSDMPGNTKTMRLDIEYPIDLGDALTVVFKELAKYGIKCRVVKAGAF